MARKSSKPRRKRNLLKTAQRTLRKLSPAQKT